jgi:hypothetical protein
VSLVKKIKVKVQDCTEDVSIFGLSMPLDSQALAQCELGAGVFPVITSLLRTCNDAALKEECTMVLANPWSSSVGITYEVGEKLLEEKVPEVRGCKLLCTGH